MINGSHFKQYRKFVFFESTGANGVNYEYAYDGFGNAIKTYVNGEEVLEVKSYKDSTYSSTDESTYDYEEVVLGKI